MSTELLAERRRTYDIPELPYLPCGKVVLVFRLPNETRTSGGLFLAETAQEPKTMGVLVGAGLEAMDILKDHLIEIGDIVWFGKFEGWEHEVKRDAENKGKQINQFKVDGILGSVDAIERVQGKNPTHRLVYDAEAGQHKYEETTWTKKDSSSKTSSPTSQSRKSTTSQKSAPNPSLEQSPTSNPSANGVRHG